MQTQEQGVQVVQNSYGGTVMYIITGPRELVLQKAQEYERHYPPAGYGTQIVGKEQIIDETNGIIKVFVERSRTSD